MIYIEVIQDLKQLLPIAAIVLVWVVVALWLKHNDTR